MYGDEEYLLSGDVLAARNDDVGRVNNALFRMSKCEEVELKSVDSAAMEGAVGLYPVDLLNGLDISDPHRIRYG